MSTPHDRQLVDFIIQTWKSDPSTEKLNVRALTKHVQKLQPEWVVEESRVYALLDMFGLLPETEVKRFTFADKIRSEMAPDVPLPDGVEIEVAQGSGKGLYARKAFAAGTKLWEEDALFFVPSLIEADHMASGHVCTHCGRVLSSDAKKVKCSARCENRYCSRACQKAEKVHRLTHGEPLAGRRFDAISFAELKQCAEEQQWNGLYAVGVIEANLVLDKSATRAAQFGAMAGVEQEARSEPSAGLLQEQQDAEMQRAYELFRRAFPEYQGAYRDFSYMMGTYNLNNLGNRIYLVYSHLNHNCEPNVRYNTEGGRVTVYASRDIDEGEQLFTTYVDPTWGVDQRRETLRVNWGFLCECGRCKREE